MNYTLRSYVNNEDFVVYAVSSKARTILPFKFLNVTIIFQKMFLQPTTTHPYIPPKERSQSTTRTDTLPSFPAMMRRNLISSTARSRYDSYYCEVIIVYGFRTDRDTRKSTRSVSILLTICTVRLSAGPCTKRGMTTDKLVS